MHWTWFIHHNPPPPYFEGAGSKKKHGWVVFLLETCNFPSDNPLIPEAHHAAEHQCITIQAEE